MAYTNGIKNGNGYKNGNGRSARHNAGLESLGFVVAEGASMATGLGVVAVADQILPGAVNAGCSVVAHTLVEPFLDPIEKVMSKVCKLEECQPDQKLSRHQRAEQLSKVIVVFAASAIAAFQAKMHTRRFMNKAFKIPNGHSHHGHWIWNIIPNNPKEATIMLADDGLHYGLTFWMNTTPQGAKKTDEMIRSTADTLHNVFNIPKAKAHELAAYTMIWELPNLAGLMAGLGAIGVSHKYPQVFVPGH